MKIKLLILIFIVMISPINTYSKVFPSTSITSQNKKELGFDFDLTFEYEQDIVDVSLIFNPNTKSSEIRDIYIIAGVHPDTIFVIPLALSKDNNSKLSTSFRLKKNLIEETVISFYCHKSEKSYHIKLNNFIDK